MLRCFIDVCEKFEGELHLAGSISLTWDPKLDECYIGVLWVNPEFRGNGLATYILKAIIHFADELGIVLTLLAIPFITPNIKPTDEDILKSKNFFQQLGFKTCLGRTGIAFGCPMDRLPDINHPTKNIPQFMVAAHKI
ncbi:MAG: GNAT family N-acetyltransferase [Candidatus Hodarchaeota archaeon]